MDSWKVKLEDKLMRIAIIGGGLTGLTAGYYLSKAGHSISIFEKEANLGGLASCFQQKDWQWPLEFYFHHIFTSDYKIINLAKKLGIGEKIFFLKPKTSIFKNSKISQFDSPTSVLKSPLLSPMEKLRTSLVTAYLKYLIKTPRTVAGWSKAEAMTPPRWKNWKLEKVTATKWLRKFYGQKTYATIWEPLLKSKFGNQFKKISMTWFWARIKKRSSSLGYFEGGFQILIDSLAKKIKTANGQILTNFEAKNLNDIYHYSDFDKLIFTTPISVFLKITKDKLSPRYVNQLESLEMIGAINLVLVLKEKFLTDNTYWLNINEQNFPFVAVVEHTNFIDPKYYGGNHILYVGGYYPQNHPFFKMTKAEIFNEFLPFLKKINPKLNFKLCTLHFALFANKYAQPIIPLNYSKLIPSIKTPIPNVYLATMHQIYPWDRGTNYAVELGKKVAYEIDNRNCHSERSPAPDGAGRSRRIF